MNLQNNVHSAFACDSGREGLDKAIDDLEVEISNAHAQNEMTRSLYKASISFPAVFSNSDKN